MTVGVVAKDREQGVGASVRRKEDARYLEGKGEYLADLQVPGMAEVAFLRSPVAHAHIRGIEIPEQYRDQVFAYVEKEDTPRPLLFQLDLLRQAAVPVAGSRRGAARRQDGPPQWR